MKTKNIFLAICLITSVAASAQKVTVSNLTVRPGAQSTITVKLTGASNYIAAGFTLELPNGLFLVNSSDIDYTTTLDKNFVANHVAVPNLLNNKNLKVAIYSTTNTPFVGGNSSSNSTLLQVGFKAYGMAAGSYQCAVKGIELVNGNLELKRLSNATFTITVVPNNGDVNGDGRVNVSDVATLINMILGITPKDEARADVNGDGRVNVSDVAALINIILGITN